MAACREGRYSGAKKAASAMTARLLPNLKMMPLPDSFVMTPARVEVCFNEATAVLARPEPAKELLATHVTGRTSRAFALAATGKRSRLKKEPSYFTAEAATTQQQNAVETQDTIYYDEPDDWYCPVRESLGAAFLAADKPAEAEQVLRADLRQHPRTPRSLFGQMKSLRPPEERRRRLGGA